MENRVKQMQASGLISPKQDDSIDTVVANAIEKSNSLAFSGYGQYTPIKVTSSTSLVNADVERNRH